MTASSEQHWAMHINRAGDALVFIVGQVYLMGVTTWYGTDVVIVRCAGVHLDPSGVEFVPVIEQYGPVGPVDIAWAEKLT